MSWAYADSAVLEDVVPSEEYMDKSADIDKAEKKTELESGGDKPHFEEMRELEY